MGRIDKEEIGYRQQLIMQCLWEAGEPTTVGDIIDRLEVKCDRRFAGPTINTQIQILINKGLVRQGGKIRQSYTYMPLITKEEFRVRELKRISRLTFDGSASAMVVSMLRGGISEEELQKIRKLINDENG